MKQLFALALAATMVVTGASPLMAANGTQGNQSPANNQPAPQTTQAPPVQSYAVNPGFAPGGGVPNRGASPGQIATGAVVGTVLVGGTAFILTNRRKGDQAPSSHAANRGPTPFLIFTHGSSHVHS